MNAKTPERIVIKAKAVIAPVNTVNLGCFIAMIAAMKNVLSPISDTKITEIEATNACTKPRFSPGTALVVPGSPSF